jgi:dynein heavy chain
LLLSQLLSGALLTQTHIAGGGGVAEKDEMIIELATDILSTVPKPFDVKAVAEHYPMLYTDSVNTVLRQVSCQNGIFYCHFHVISSFVI